MCSEKTTRWLFLMLFYFNITNGLDKDTADQLLRSTSHVKCSAKDECIILKNCKSYMDFVNNSEKPLKASVVEFLRGEQCGFDQGYPKVCCKVDLGSNIFTIPSPKLNYKSCPTKSNCTPLKDCKPYMDLVNLVEKPLNSLMVEFLRAQQCGFQEGYPTVCCSPVPKDIKISILSTRPNNSKKQKNKLSAELDMKNNVDKHKTNVNPPESVSDRNKEKAEAINKAFDLVDFFDFMGPFDLLRRKRFGGTDDKLNLEIR